MDANVILRFLTNEPAAQAERAARLFAGVDAGVEAILLEDIVAAEVVWTLASYYRLPKAKIAETLLSLLASPSVQNPDKRTLQAALVLFHQHNLDFADALLAARVLATGERELYSFDRDFDRVPGVVRLEPV